MTRLWMTWLRVQGWTTGQALRGPSLLRKRKDEGAGEILVFVVMTGLLVAAAIIIVGIVVSKATHTANNIQTQ